MELLSPSDHPHKRSPGHFYKSFPPGYCGSCRYWTDSDAQTCDLLCQHTYPRADFIIEPQFGCNRWRGLAEEGGEE